MDLPGDRKGDFPMKAKEYNFRVRRSERVLYQGITTISMARKIAKLNRPDCVLEVEKMNGLWKVIS